MAALSSPMPGATESAGGDEALVLGRLGALLLVAALAVVALIGRGRAPFWAAVAIAVVDAALLVAAG